jgi:hypothetical protein
VTNDDPTSLLRWGGPFGKVARIETSGAVANAAQAAEVGAALLAQRSGLARALSVSAAPNPALEASDVVTLSFADGRVEEHLIDAVRLGLDARGGQTFAVHATNEPSAQSIPLPSRRFGVRYGRAAWREFRRARVVSVA